MTTPITVAVGGVAVRDGAILLIERGTEPAKGKWSVPGGRLEPGETMAQAVVRELAEETGLTVRAGEMIAIAERIGPGHHVLIANHHVEIIGPTTPTAGDDAAATGQQIKRLDRGRRPLPVISASKDELAAHETQLDAIAASSGGRVLWRENSG